MSCTPHSLLYPTCTHLYLCFLFVGKNTMLELVTYLVYAYERSERSRLCLCAMYNDEVERSQQHKQHWQGISIDHEGLIVAEYHNGMALDVIIYENVDHTRVFVHL